ncbi:MAG: cobaltochelatase subunit CobS, partial [Rhodospirillaceae bacterium]|nr:cobaltochelatase subunit CobS [Rhodospirillales bacterium]
MTASTQSPLASDHPLAVPDIEVSVRETFGIDIDMKVPAFSQGSEHVPEIDPAYRFDRDTTLAILAGFAFNRRV